MAVRLPPSNLNPAAQPWGRRVELLLEELSNGQAGIRTNHTSITRAVGAVTRAVPTLAAQFATVTSRVAGAPSALSGVATGYFDSVTGNAEASVVLTWTAPTAYTDSTPMVPLLYEIHRMLPGGVWAFVTNVTDPSATLLRQPYGGGAVQYRVRAQGDNGGYSAWSDPATVTMPGTMAPPAAPSTPTLTSKNGMVIVTWDGKLGTATPGASVRGVYVETGPLSSTYSQAGQLMQAAGGRQSAIGPYPLGEVRFVRLRAVDALGQVSAPSTVASITVVGVAGPDIVANSLTTNLIQAGQITSALIDTTGLTGITITGGTIQTSATAARGVKLTGTGLQAFNSSGVATFTVDGTTGAVVANTLTATGATISGTITATGGSITGTLTVTGQIQTGASGARVQINSAGIAGYASGGNVTFQFLTTDGFIRAWGGVFDGIQVTGNSQFGGTLSGATGTFSGSLSGATGSFSGSLSGATGTFSGSLSAASGSFTGTLSGATGSFTGTVTATGGSITGNLTVSGQLRTAASGQRVTLDQYGVTAYTSGGDSLNLQGQFLQHTNASGSLTNSVIQFSDGALFLMFGTATRTADFTLSDDGQPRISSNAILNRHYSNSVRMATPDANGAVAPLVITDQGTIGASVGSLWSMAGPDTYPRWQSDTGGVSWIQSSSAYTQLYSSDSTHLGLRMVNGSTTQFRAIGGTDGSGNVQAANILGLGGNNGSSLLEIGNDGSSAGVNFVRSMSIYNRVYTSGSRTGASGNRIVVVTSSGTLGWLNAIINSDYLPASSAAFKHDIVDWDGDLEKLLSLRPVRFKYNDDYLPDDRGREHVGFIAEEVRDAGLEILTSTDGDGNLHGVEYSNMTAGLLALAKDQERRISALEERLNRLTPA